MSRLCVSIIVMIWFSMSISCQIRPAKSSSANSKASGASAAPRSSASSTSAPTEELSPQKIAFIKKFVEQSELNMESSGSQSLSKDRLRGDALAHFEAFTIEHGQIYEPTARAASVGGVPLIFIMETSETFSAIEVFNDKGQYLMKYSGSGSTDWVWDR